MRNLFIGSLLLYWMSASVFADVMPWRTLSTKQHEALSPLEPEWNKLPEAQQQHLLKTAKGYERLNAEEKKRFHSSLPTWSKLTHEQREAARAKYKAFQKVPVEQRQEVKQMIKRGRENKAQATVDVTPQP